MSMQSIRSVSDVNFVVPLCDLGSFDPNLTGIFCPEPEIGAEKVGITDQFLADAETYHTRYSNASHFTRLFAQALEEAGVIPPPGCAVLDLGTGSGTNTIVPCLKMFEDCRIVATDLSPDLLRILRYYVVAQKLEERVVCVCTDAMRNFFRPRSFDIVIGAAILHHLMDPAAALATAYNALRPGGIGLFFEPFEGLSVLRIAFELVLDRSERELLPIAPEGRKVLEAMCLDWATRAGSDKTAPHFPYMDDKWLFTRSWLSRAARTAGFEEPLIVPHAAHATLFQDYTKETLRLAAGLEAASLPDWAWAMIARFDAGFSAEMKQDVLLEGTIVLRKPAHE